MGFPALRWGPGVAPSVREIIDYRFRTGIATRAEMRAWVADMLSADPPETASAEETAEAARKCAEADRGGYR